MFNRLAHYYRRLPHYLAHRASPYTAALLTRWLYSQTIPHRQDAPVVILTMGKVGSMTLVQSLLNSGVLFIKQLHNLNTVSKHYPYRISNTIRITRATALLRRTHYPWLLRRPKVRIITTVREPISRLVSLYLYTYTMRFGEILEDASLQTLLDDFPRIFEQDYSHPLVPGHFLTNEIEALFDIDVYQHPFSQPDGSASIEQGRFSLLVMKLEISDEQKAATLSSWMNRPVYITRKNTAKDEGYADIYEEFKRRVRIPYRYAEAIYRSSYMQHFYTPEERTKYWQRWEPQLDRSLSLPDWVEDQLNAYHPPVD